MTVPRGPDEVRAALVDAASALLGEKPPQRITGRELAERAALYTLHAVIGALSMRVHK